MKILFTEDFKENLKEIFKFIKQDSKDRAYNFRDSLKNEIIKMDTLQYILAKPNGEWLGNGFGSVKEILLQYKNNYLFPNNGKYQIEIKHGMRADELKGMEDIGIKIENVN